MSNGARFYANYTRIWHLSLFEKVILANSLMLLGEALAGLWITSHNLEAHHYLIDTSFIVVATLLSLLINVLLIRAFLYPGLAKALIRAYVSDASFPATDPASPHQDRAKASSLAQALRVLTPREVEILRLVAEGRTNQQIADQLVLSIKTVQAHRANVMEKLDLHDITQLVRFAVLHGLIPLAEDVS